MRGLRLEIAGALRRPEDFLKHNAANCSFINYFNKERISSPTTRSRTVTLLRLRPNYQLTQIRSVSKNYLDIETVCAHFKQTSSQGVTGSVY